MSKADTFWMGVVMGLFVAFLFATWVTRDWDPYKNGQIDAINGNIKYELVEQADGSTSWERIGEQRATTNTTPIRGR